jgi:aspartate aminotransferase-like enzyme
VADGQNDLKGKIFRIGHLGIISERDVYTVLACLEQTLVELGVTTVTLGVAVAAAQQASNAYWRANKAIAVGV